jgi:hypothetical protein
MRPTTTQSLIGMFITMMFILISAGDTQVKAAGVKFDNFDIVVLADKSAKSDEFAKNNKSSENDKSAKNDKFKDDESAKSDKLNSDDEFAKNKLNSDEFNNSKVAWNKLENVKVNDYKLADAKAKSETNATDAYASNNLKFDPAIAGSDMFKANDLKGVTFNKEADNLKFVKYDDKNKDNADV